MNTVDDRIAAALRARADSVTEADLTPAAPPSHRVVPLARGRWTIPLLAAAAAGILAFATVTVVQLNRSTGHPAGPVPQPSVTLLPPSTVAPTPSTAAPTPSGTTTSAQPTSSQALSTVPLSTVPPTASQPVGQAFTLGYQPLWPFASYAEAEQWRSTASGSQPWHLDPGQTATDFTGVLGLSDITEVIGTRLDKLGAHVAVGYRDPNGQQHTAAVLHLVRFGTAKDSPWEVVGSDDTTLSLEQPAYGSRVTSPLTIGGHISGVDENIVVSLVRVIDSNQTESKVLARVPAGGEHAAWTTGPVPFTARGVLIVLATTGGHLRQVERFAIQGVHT